jgi:hypothetical protein
MRHSLFARFLLIFALLFAQMGGLTHGISHAMADQTQDQSAPHDKLCELCATYAQLGSALGSHAIAFTSLELKSALVATPFDSLLYRISFSAFAARAPPYSA